MMHPKFGDRIRGIYASESNPKRDGYFVRVIHRVGRLNHGTYYECTDGNGSFWQYPMASTERLPASDHAARVAELTRQWTDAEHKLAMCEADLIAMQQRAERAEAEARGLREDCRAWRSRFITERRKAYPDMGYEEATAYAEADANEYIDVFHERLAALKDTP